MGLIDKFNKGLDKTVNKLDDAITRAGEDDKAHIDRYVKDLGLSDKVKAEAQDISPRRPSRTPRARSSSTAAGTAPARASTSPPSGTGSTRASRTSPAWRTPSSPSSGSTASTSRTS